MPLFTNQATLSYNDTTVNSNVATGELLEVLSATKTAVMDDYTAGDDVTYVISIVNSGAVPFTGLTVTDSLGAYAFGTGQLYPMTYVEGSLRLYVSGVLQPTPSVTAGPPMSVSGINVPAGGNALIIYETEMNEYAPLGLEDTVTNTAVIQGTGLAAALTVSETVHPEAAPVLTVSKSICPTTVTENEPVTYTFIIQNTGNLGAEADDNAVITDVFEPVLNNISVTYNDTLWTEPEDYTYDTATGTFSTAAGKITVPAATFVQDQTSGAWVTDPGYSILTVTGTI